MINNKDKLLFITSMVIFSTIGIFRKYIPLSSDLVSFFRGIIGVIFLLLIVVFSKKKIDKQAIKNNFLVLCLSGCFIGINWLLLFEAYKYTSVSIATLCYYMSPIFVLIGASMFFKEKMNLKSIVCVIVSIIGMMFVSGLINGGFDNKDDFKGIVLGLSAAILYGSVVLLNKKITNINPYDKTITQLLFSAIILIPYIILNNSFKGISFNIDSILLLLVVGVVHTGLAYALYFASMHKISTQSVAIFSYIDPVLAIILSALILKETLTIYGIIGAILILGATFISEFNFKKSRKN